MGSEMCIRDRFRTQACRLHSCIVNLYMCDGAILHAHNIVSARASRYPAAAGLVAICSSLDDTYLLCPHCISVQWDSGVATCDIIFVCTSSLQRLRLGTCLRRNIEAGVQQLPNATDIKPLDKPDIYYQCRCANGLAQTFWFLVHHGPMETSCLRVTAGRGYTQRFSNGSCTLLDRAH